jgi:hypothetical protein
LAKHLLVLLGERVEILLEAVNPRLQMTKLAKHLFVLLRERVEVLFDAMDALADRRIGCRLHPLGKTGSQTLNHAGYSRE